MMDKSDFHKSVLLQETIDALQVTSGKKYIDGTLGGGGHTFEILQRGGVVLGIDQDEEALEYVKEELRSIPRGSSKKQESRVGEDLLLAHGNFRDIDRIAKENGFGEVAGILLDLGVSSHQLDTAERGFSFQKPGPLDMRMDTNLGVKAKDLINGLSKGELYELFTKLGEERFSHPIVDSIIRSRRIKPIETTEELSEIVRRAVPNRWEKIHPATRVFQALRIAVNDELQNLKDALPKSISLLEGGGRLAILSFHSLEDRIVKNTFKIFEEQGLGKVVTKKPVIATAEEIAQNARSRSAKLRVFEKR